MRYWVKAIAWWLALSFIVGAVWVRTEGWHLIPAPGHWWWWAFSGWTLGLQHGGWLSDWLYAGARST